jgi:hypothetical protein
VALWLFAKRAEADATHRPQLFGHRHDLLSVLRVHIVAESIVAESIVAGIMSSRFIGHPRRVDPRDRSHAAI